MKGTNGNLNPEPKNTAFLQDPPKAYGNGNLSAV